MEKSQFHLVMHEVEVLERPYVGGAGVVEGGYIAVNDCVLVNNAGGKSPQARGGASITLRSEILSCW